MKIDRMRVFMTRDKDRPRVIVALDTDDGLTGWGECYNHGPDKALPPLLDYLYGFVSGQDPTRVEYLVNLLIQQSRFPPGALGLAAISALDHCLWDLAAKAVNVPVYKLLGGEVRDRIKVYAGVYTAPDAPAARDEFDRLKEGWGFTAFKLSPWRIDMHSNRWGNVVKASADYFRSLRETVNDEYEIAFDAHAKIFEPIAARQLGNALAPYDPLFFEEPLRPENIEAWGDLKQGLNCTLATGESLYNRNEFLRLLQVKGADLIQPDICVVGGISEMRRIATLAEAFFVGVAPHNPMGPLATAVNVHFSAAAAEFPHPRIPAAKGTGLCLWRPRYREAGGRNPLRRRSLSAEGRLSGTASRPAGLGRRNGREGDGRRRLHPLAAARAEAARRLLRLRLRALPALKNRSWPPGWPGQLPQARRF